MSSMSLRIFSTAQARRLTGINWNTVFRRINPNSGEHFGVVGFIRIFLTSKIGPAWRAGPFALANCERFGAVQVQARAFRLLAAGLLRSCYSVNIASALAVETLAIMIRPGVVL